MVNARALGGALGRGLAALKGLRLRRKPISRDLAVDGALLTLFLLLISVERLRGHVGIVLLVLGLIAHFWAVRSRRIAAPAPASSVPSETARSQE